MKIYKKEVCIILIRKNLLNETNLYEETKKVNFLLKH
jgi:hypothetical protein